MGIIRPFIIPVLRSQQIIGFWKKQIIILLVAETSKYTNISNNIEKDCAGISFLILWQRILLDINRPRTISSVHSTHDHNGSVSTAASEEEGCSFEGPHFLKTFPPGYVHNISSINMGSSLLSLTFACPPNFTWVEGCQARGISFYSNE